MIVCLVIGVLLASNILGNNRLMPTPTWRLYSTAPRGDQATLQIPWPNFPTHSHNPDTEQTSPCPIQVMASAKLGSDKCQFCKLVRFGWDSNFCPSTREAKRLERLCHHIRFSDWHIACQFVSSMQYVTIKYATPSIGCLDQHAYYGYLDSLLLLVGSRKLYFSVLALLIS